jgi:light-regulated signal transduction histidine kinase (bacteriophytochrome)
VISDEIQLGQIFQNLIGNALKFRGGKTPEIQITAERKGDFWEFCIADNGIGFDPQYSDRIFVIFQRLHLREEYPGSGIGLAVVKRILERHGGEIHVDSSPGNGARFYFTLPAVVSSDVASVGETG